MRAISLLALLMACTPTEPATDDGPVITLPSATGSGDMVRFETIHGAVEVQLFLDEAPVTTDNFLSYVEAGFYDGTDGNGAGTFYRALPTFVLQGGSVQADGQDKVTQAPIVNEATASGLSNVARTVAMARTDDPDSATAEFFINLEDNTALDPGGSTPDGYAVFGEVVVGWDVVETIMAQSITDDDLDAPVEFLVVTRF